MHREFARVYVCVDVQRLRAKKIEKLRASARESPWSRQRSVSPGGAPVEINVRIRLHPSRTEQRSSGESGQTVSSQETDRGPEWLRDEVMRGRAGWIATYVLRCVWCVLAVIYKKGNKSRKKNEKYRQAEKSNMHFDKTIKRLQILALILVPQHVTETQ